MMSQEYLPLSQADATQEKQQDKSQPPRRQERRQWLPYFLHLLAFCVYTMLFFRWSSDHFRVENCVRRLSSWSPALPAVSYSTTTFDGKIGGENDYKGSPTPAIDKAWARISMQVPGIRLFEADFTRMNKSLSARRYHQLPDSVGGGYLGMTEVFHLLHCLDAVRRATYPDHYAGMREENQVNLRYHTDHCIDIIRQRLMCTGDVGPVPFYDDANPLNTLPLPDFSTTHQCRDFEQLLEWAHTNDRALKWDEVGDLNLTHHG